MPDERRYQLGHVGSGRFVGEGYTVLPVRVRADSRPELVERIMGLLDELEGVVEASEGAEVLGEVSECLEACEFACEMYRAQIRRLAAEKARDQ